MDDVSVSDLSLIFSDHLSGFSVSDLSFLIFSDHLSGFSGFSVSDFSFLIFSDFSVSFSSTFFVCDDVVCDEVVYEDVVSCGDVLSARPSLFF